MKIKEKFKLFNVILNLKYVTVEELQSYVLFNNYLQYGDIIFVIISVSSGILLYYEAGFSPTSSVIFFCLYMLVKSIIDMFLLYGFNKRIVKDRIKKFENFLVNKNETK